MATGKKYFWIKLNTSFMTSDKVDYLMSQTNGAEYVVLYQMLCMKCINTNGLLARQIGEVIIPFDAEKIARDCKYFNVDTVKQAFHLFITLGMIYQESNGYLRIANFENMVGCETDWCVQKRKQKENGLPKLTAGIIKRVNEDSIKLPNGKIQLVDEKKYGGNGALAYDLAGCICEKCGESDKELQIHHNNGISNDVDDLVVLCSSCYDIAHDSTHNGILKLDELKYRHYGFKIGGNTVERGVENFHTDIDIRDRDRYINLNIYTPEKDEKTKTKTRKQFITPTLEEIKAYISEKNYCVDPQVFYDYYTSSDWCDIQGNKIKNWKSKIVTWNSRDKNKQGNNSRQSNFLPGNFDDRSL